MEVFWRFFALLMGLEAVLASSSIFVQDGIYSRVTVQIEDQPQPASCVDFLDHLEVRSAFLTARLE